MLYQIQSGNITSQQYQGLFTSGVSVGNGADLTEDIIKTFSVPGNTLLNIGDKLHIVAAGAFAASTDAKTARIRFGGISGTILNAASGNAAGQTSWTAEAWITITSVGNFAFAGMGVTVGAPTGGGASGTAALDLTAAQTLAVTGQNATTSTAGSITCTYFQVELIRAP